MPRPDPKVSSYDYGHANSGVAALIAYLCDWYDAIEDGNAAHRQPDRAYQRPQGRPDWSAEDLDRIIAAIDEEYAKEVTGAPGKAVGAAAGPGFDRLEHSQRLAFVQGLELTIIEHRPALRTLSTDTAIPSQTISANGRSSYVRRNYLDGGYDVTGAVTLHAETDAEAQAQARAAMEAMPGTGPYYPPSYSGHAGG